MKEQHAEPRALTVCYLAGPMSNVPEWNFPAFNEAAWKLRGEGWTVVNPAENFDGDTSLAYEDYLALGIRQVTEVDCVFVLPGWQKSKGACREVDTARFLKKPVYNLDGSPVPFPDSIYEHLTELNKHLTEVAHELQAELSATRAENLVLKTHREDTRPITLIAHDLVNGNRGEAYGHPFHDFTRSGKIFAAILGLPEVTPEQVALCMMGIKISRECNKPGKDNAVDIAGYSECLHKIHEYRAHAS